MKPRTVTILWIVALVLGLSVFLMKKSSSREEKNATNLTPGQTLLADFPADKAASIEITGAELSVNLALKEGKWTVSQRDGFPANSRNINDLLRTLAELKVAQCIEAGPSFAPRFGMDEKSSTAETRGITAAFKDASGKELAKVSFGKNLDAASSSSPFGGGATGRYVRNHADESGFYAVSEVFGTLSEDPKSWLSEDFIKVEKIKGISLTKPASDQNEWEFTRADENAEFAFTEAYPGVKTDAAATSPLKSLFSFSRFDDVVPAAEVEKKATPEKLQKAVITTFEGFTYRITLQPAKPAAAKEGAEAPPATDNYLMTVAVEAALPKERKKPEAEKPEEAEAAQKAFDERLKELTESLEKSKALQGRTFEVSKFTVDALLKNRTEFMDKGPARERLPLPFPKVPPLSPRPSRFPPCSPAPNSLLNRSNPLPRKHLLSSPIRSLDSHPDRGSFRKFPMLNPHDHPTALKDLQDSIYREKILRARAMTREERFIAGVELTNEVSRRILQGAMARLGTDDESVAWADVHRRASRLRKTHDYGYYSLKKPAQ